MSKFQLILLSVFGIFIIIGVMVFSMTKSTGGVSATTVVIWGDVSSEAFGKALVDTGGEANNLPKVQYVYKPKSTFSADLTEAIATGKGPDAVVLSTSNFWKNQNKIYPIPSSNLSQADFKNTFIQEGELLLNTDGAYGLPIVVDPMVLYWNRDLFSKASLVAPPKYWDEIYDVSKKLTEKDDAGNIQKSAIAMGTTKNIPNSKSILSLLMLQAGTPITAFTTDRFHSMLNQRFDLPILPAGAALDFYTQFSNPTKQFYTWNISMLPAQTSFTSGNSAMYLGFASELPIIKAKNPTLNLGVATVPQSRVSNKSITFGDLEVVAVLRSSKNITPAFSTIFALVNSTNNKVLADAYGVASVRRDALSTAPTDYFQAVFTTSAIQATGWLDPDNDKTTSIFTAMIDDVTSGRAQTTEAISKADSALDAILNQ